MNMNTSTTAKRSTKNAQYYSDYIINQLYQQIKTEFDIFVNITDSNNNNNMIAIHDHDSTDTAHKLSYEDYITARLQVLTRSFTGGLLQDQEFTSHELQNLPFLKDSSHKQALSAAMVPLLDSFNHHTNQNVNWKYIDGSGAATTTSSSSSSSFVLFATQDITDGGIEIMSTYGTTTTDSR